MRNCKYESIHEKAGGCNNKCFNWDIYMNNFGDAPFCTLTKKTIKDEDILDSTDRPYYCPYDKEAPCLVSA